ncbi:hypothetical protein KKJFFJLC_00051 [Vibrio phage vB_VpaS_PGB]|nr:hypothetical protein HHKILHMN_00046 [Vibrio phage vB_VpaS_PGA]WVH05594.1 hypothetical protein KKJFFJLC_00051 [Vibrio phage vB_VpaS_PGB]
MNYENATNEELNNRLLELIHGDVVNYWCLSDDETFIYDCGPTGDSFYKINLHDYCSDWNATMPLAVEYGITIYLEGTRPKAMQVSGGSETLIIDQDPLRAIVFCLIKVLEAKNGSK